MPHTRSRTKVHLEAPPDSQVVDACTLGRPVQLLAQFTEKLGDALDEMFRAHSRRYRARYVAGELSMQPVAAATGSAGRWRVAELPDGPVACLIERRLLLSLMSHRYGDAAAKDHPGSVTDASAMPSAEVAAVAEQPETMTEQRLLDRLCRQVLAQALQLIGNAQAAEPVLESLALHPSTQPLHPAGCWLVRVPVSEATQDLHSQILLVLGPGHVARLLQKLVQAQPPRGASSLMRQPAQAQLVKELQLRLQARLLEQQITLGELVALRPGDLIPIRLKAADVLVDGSRLFTASVAEHQGKLCLTSFADTD